MTGPGSARFIAWVGLLEEQLDERAEAIRLVLLALCAKSHVLLLGLPGTGKSMLAQSDGALFQTRLRQLPTCVDVS